MSRPASRLVLVAALVVVAAACHGGGGKTASDATTTSRPRTSTSTAVAGSTSSTAATTTSTSTSRPTPSTAVTAPPRPAPCGPAQHPNTTFSTAAPADTDLLTAVTLRHTARCTDTVTFTFSSPVARAAGLTVKLVQPPFTRVESGAPLAIGGQRFYQVQFEPASTFDFTTGRSTYSGPTSLALPGAAHVVQVVETGAAEGVVTWIIGVHAADQFVPSVAVSPPALTLTF